MENRIFQRICALVMSAALLSAGTPALTYAGIIDTGTYVESAQRDADLATLSAGLHRQEVRDQLIKMGVEPAQVETRLTTLSDSELRQLADRMDQLPAGGDILALIGVVFVVLLILELVGVIDIFKKTP